MSERERPPKKARQCSIARFFKKSDDTPPTPTPATNPTRTPPSTPKTTSTPIPATNPTPTPSTTPYAYMPNPIDNSELSLPLLEFERDPGLRKKIWELPVNQQDEIRRAYIQAGPYQPKLDEYPKKAFGKQFRKFQYAWFQQFPWLEYSPTTNKAYCFPCFIFQSKDGHKSRSALVDEGFDNWKKVNDNEKCVFLCHAGNNVSNHNNCLRAMQDLVNSSQNIDKVFNAQSKEDVRKNRLRLHTSIKVARWLAMQGCAFRGRDESASSSNRGNFLELVHEFTSVNLEIRDVVENAPRKGLCMNLEAIDLPCQMLQRKNQNILTAVRLVTTTKGLLNRLREDGWDTFIDGVKSFCQRNLLVFPDTSQPYSVGRYRLHKQQITIEHYYHFEIFNQAIDFQITELNNRFNESTIELLTLTEALNPDDSFKSFNIEDICKLATKFYPNDFNGQEIHALRTELLHYRLDVLVDAEFCKISLLSDLSAALVRTKRTEIYYLVYRLIRLVLTLPVSTATTERAFSAMKHVKNEIRNRMEDEFLADAMTLFIERDLSKNIDIDSIIYDFDCLKSRRVQLK